MRKDQGASVAELIKKVDEVLKAGDPARLGDAKLDRMAASILRRAQGSYSLCAMVFQTLAVLHRERSRVFEDGTASIHHDLALLFMHSRYAANPLALLREAEVLREQRHLPLSRPRHGDQRPFTEYLSNKHTLIARRRGVPGDDVVRDARLLSKQLHDPYLKADVDAFLRSLGEEPPTQAATPPPTPASGLFSPPTSPVPPPDSWSAEEDAARVEEESLVYLARLARGGTPLAAEAMRLLQGFEAEALHEAEAHEDHFLRTHDPDALERAMRSTSRASLCATLAGEEMRSLGHGMDIGRLYAIRFSLLGNWDDATRAIASMRMVIAELPPGEPAVVGCLVQLAVTLEAAHENMLSVYGTDCGTENIDAAITELRKARHLIDVGMSPPDDEDLLGTVLAHLGHCLLSRAFIRKGADARERDLSEALELLDQATTLLGDGGNSPDQPMASSRQVPGRAEVVTMLRLYRVQGRMLRAMVDGDVVGFEEIIATVRERIRTGNDPSMRPSWQLLLGSAQVWADELSGRNAMRPSVLAELREAAEGDTGSEGPQRTIHAARLAAGVAMHQHQWPEAAALLRRALQRIHGQRENGIPDSARLRWLGQGRGLTGELVTCLVAMQQVQEAVVAFEENRAVLLSEVLGDSADTIGLDAVAPDLAHAHRAVAQKLRGFGNTVAGLRPHHSASRRALLREKERVAERIRMVDGFTRFGQAPRYPDLAMREADGPTVLLNVAFLRGDALVLQNGDVSVVPLPDMRLDRLEPAVGTLHRALRAAEEARSQGDGRAYMRQQQAVGSVLEQLWETIAAPVWELIAARETFENPPRIWWVPSGPLWFLPLHTASAAGGPSLADLAVSSYVPTIRMLKQSRRRPPGALRRPLVVSVPHAPGAPPLRGAEAEAEMLTRLMPGTRQGAAATREAVLNSLGRHSCLHFAGHGVNTPEGTLLLLHDCDQQTFAARDVLDQDLPPGDLAYLSACEAAQTSALLPDEATHFGAALLVAGYRHVIGTLWRVDDTVAVEAAQHFYLRLAGATRFDPALALHETVRQLRATYPSMPGLWASHIHIGP